MKSLTKQWLVQAQYDLATAEAMFKTKRYLYVAFMCQQAIEKLIKGTIQERRDATPPYSHRLSTLAENAGITYDQKQFDFLDLLTRYYINTRYPEQKQQLAKSLNKTSTERLLRKTKEHFQWLKNKLET